MSVLKIVFFLLFVVKLSSQQCKTKMKWCLEPKYVGADNRDVDIETCRHRPCIIGTCPYGQMNYNKQCVRMDAKIGPTPVDFSSILALYKLKMGTPVKTGKFLDNDQYQIVTLKNRKAHLKTFNNCTTDNFFTMGENEIFDGHFLEDGSFLLKDTILPAGEYVVRFTITNTTGTWQPVLKIKFAKDIQPTDTEILMDKVFAYAMLVSVLFMVLLLIVYVLCKELRSTAGLILMTYVTALVIAFSLLVTRELSLIYGVIGEVGCYVISISIHFFVFSFYFWMNIMGFDIWWTLRNMYYGTAFRRGVDYVKFRRYCCIASLPPLLYVIVEVCLDEFTQTYGPKFKNCTACSAKWYVAGVVLPLQAFNIIPFVLTVFNLWRIQQSTQTQLNNSNSCSTGPAKQNALLSIKISVMMGTNWFLDVMVFIFYDDMPDWFNYTAKMYNSLIGLILFLVYIIKWDVLLKLFRRLSIDNEMTRKIERRVSRHHSSYKSRKWSQQSSSSGTVMHAVNSQPDIEDNYMNS